MRLASTSDRVDIDKVNRESQIRAERERKRQPKGSSCVLKVKAANMRTIMLDPVICMHQEMDSRIDALELSN